MILPGSASQSIGAALADSLDMALGPVDTGRFPDGELIVSIPEDPGEDVIVVGSTTTARGHVELLLIQDAAREAGAERITTVIPYLGYARQHRAFEPGQPISVRAVAKAISSGCDRVLVVNPHEEAVLSHFTVPATDVSAGGQLAAALPADLTEPLFLAPDAGARALAREVCEAYAAGSVDHFEKTRRSGRRVEIAPSDTTVDGRDVVVVDDIIATGGTMAEAVRVLTNRTANRVLVACIHPLLTGSARAKLAAAGVETIIATDTIERPASVVSAAPAIVSALE